MIGRIARRLGFEPSVPVALIDDWHVPSPTRSFVELAPREGASSCLVDQFGRLQVAGGSWTLDLTLAAGARWVPVSQADRVTQKLVSPGVLETTIQTPSGPVTQRVAAGIVDAAPVAIIEIENTGGVAIAAGMVARPLRLDGRGFIGEAAVDAAGIALDGHRAVSFVSAPATVAACDGSQTDLLQNLPHADDGATDAAAKCRSGGTQAAAVWPLPHTATLRVVVGLAHPPALTAAVPTTSDVNRGWETHLKQGMRVDVDGVDVAENLATASRSALTLWPDRDTTPTAIVALSELGFGRDAGRLFDLLEHGDDDAAVIRALARWAQLGEQGHQLDDLERILGRLARAAHGVDARGGEIGGSAWLDAGLVALGGRLHQIDQPDVAERVQGFVARAQPTLDAGDRMARLTNELDKRGVWPDSQMRSSCDFAQAVRAAVVEDAGHELRLLPKVPRQWRGRTIDVFGVPVANGNVSFGLRWHGPRAALLWEATLAPEAPVHITIPGIDPGFESSDRQGEVLLADPGWSTS